MKRKGLLISTLVMSLGGLAVDQFLLSGGEEGGPMPAKATPDQLMAMGAAAVAGPSASKAESPKGPPVRDLIASLSMGGGLGSMASFDAGSGTPDAFAALDWAESGSTVGPRSRGGPDGGLRLTAVLTGSRPAAVVNGLVLRPGVAREGLTLVRVEGDRALVERDGERVELTLDR